MQRKKLPKSLFAILFILSICRATQDIDEQLKNDPIQDQARPRKIRKIINGDGKQTQPLQVSTASADSKAIASGGSTAISNSTALSLPQKLIPNGAAVATATATATAVASDGSIAVATSQATAISSPVLAGRFFAGDIEFDIDDYSIFFVGCHENKADINYDQNNHQFKMGSFDQGFSGCDDRYNELGKKLSKTKRITFKDNVFRSHDENNNELFTFRRETRAEKRERKRNLRRRLRKQRRYIRNKKFNPQNQSQS